MKTKQNFNIEEAINRVASGEHPRRVLFVGAKSSVVSEQLARASRQLLKDASILATTAQSKLESHPDIADELKEQFDLLESTALELRKKLYALGSVTESDDEYDDDEEDDDEMQEAEDADGEGDSNVLNCKIAGVEDPSEFKSAMKSLAADYGGVAEFSETFIDEGEVINYDTVGGSDEDIKDGDDPDDETGTPKKDASDGVDDLDAPNPDASAPIDTRESFRFRKTESVLVLAKHHAIKTKKSDK